jgi:predicted alpha-1,2-mannosidase
MQSSLSRLFLFALIVLVNNGYAQTNYRQYVNPFIGTGGHGHTYPGATLPHGMVQLSPDTRLDGWDGCGGYHYSDSFIYGFTHTHLSGTGVSDYGDVLLMPMQGPPSDNRTIYGSAFHHQQETARPGYYAVRLLDDAIDADFTASNRVGLHRYRFSRSGNASVIIDLEHRDAVIRSSIRLEDSVTVTGMRISKAWAREQHVYFVIKFSQPIRNWQLWNQHRLTAGTFIDSATSLQAAATFDVTATPELLAKVAISPVSIAGARLNLEAEMPGWDFEAVRTDAENRWETELAKIEVRDTTTTKLTKFYTALYHTALAPTINMDVDRQYRGRDNQIHRAEDFDYYSVFSLWDTYRATHPLYTLIDQQRTVDYIRTFLAQYQEGGRLPVWELSSNETDCMIGYHSVPVIADAYLKGIRGFDTTLALQAMQKSANWNHYGLPAYVKNGLIQVDDEHESVSKTLEYAYDDWCIARYAGLYGDSSVRNQYIRRAQYYKNVFDPKTGFMRPRKNGGWLSPFDPREVNNHFTEANSWQYSFYVPQDIAGLIRLQGGEAAFARKLDRLFAEPTQTTGRDQADITGLIGQYAQGNEPSHHIAYLYNYVGQSYKTQALVHQILDSFYTTQPDGLIGNEDCGQMSAWFVMSALGFYPVTPSSNQYVIGSPYFSMVQINLENGRNFIVNAPGAAEGKKYIHNALLSTTASLRPKDWPFVFLNHADIANGGLITFMMDDKPSDCFNQFRWQEPAISEPRDQIVLNPVIDGGEISYVGSKTIRIEATKGNAIYYAIGNDSVTGTYKRYTAPFTIRTSARVRAYAVGAGGQKSFITEANYICRPNNWTVKLNTAYEPQYAAAGPVGLVDHIYGSTNWRMGNWQGYQKTPVDAVVDLGKQQTVSNVQIRFLQDTRSWIVMPKKVTVAVSADGMLFEPVYSGTDFMPVENLEPTIRKVEARFSATPVRYVRVQAEQYGTLPAWHEGAGGDTHIFLDEIEVN